MNRFNLLLLSSLLGFSGHAFAQTGEVVCWGGKSFGICDAPDGVFTQVAAGFYHSLDLLTIDSGVRVDHTFGVGFCFVLGFVVFGHGVNLRVNAFVNA